MVFIMDKDDFVCPLSKDNPHTCVLAETMEIMKERTLQNKIDISWLKKGYTIQILIGTGTFLSVLGILIKLLG